MARFAPVLALFAVFCGSAGAVFEPAPPVAFDLQFGTSGTDRGHGVAHDAAGNAYVVAQTSGTFPGQTSAGQDDVVLRKLDAAGAEIWTRQFGTGAYDLTDGTLAVTPDGRCAVVGWTAGAFPGFTNQGSEDVFVRVYDADGNLLGTDQFGSSTIDRARGVSTDGTKFYVAGTTYGTLPGQTSSGGEDAFVAVYDLAGARTNLAQFGTAFGDEGTGAAADASGNVFVVGYTLGTFGTKIGGYDGFLAKFDAALAPLQQENLGTLGNDFWLGIDIGAGGEMALTGYTLGAFPGETVQGHDIAVQRIDPADLSVLWSRQLGITTDADHGNDVFVGPDGTVHVTGYTEGLEDRGPVPNRHGAVVVLDAQGQDLWNDQFNAAGATLELNGVSLDGTGRVWVSGKTAGNFAPGKVAGDDVILRAYEPFASGVTDITACGFVADAPGDYRLAADLAGSGHCIEVTADDVSIDLNGFDITVQAGAMATGSVGVHAPFRANVGIRNLAGAESTIRVENGTGVDFANTVDASVHAIPTGGGIAVEMQPEAIVGLRGGASTGLTVNGPRFYNVGTPASIAAALDLDDSVSATLQSVDVRGEYTTPRLVGYTFVNATDAQVNDSRFENVDATLGGGNWVSRRNLHVPTGLFTAHGWGTSEDDVVDGVTATIEGDAVNTTNLVRSRFLNQTGTVSFGDHVSLELTELDLRGPDAKAEFTGTIDGSSRLDSPLVSQYVNDDWAKPLISSQGTARFELEGTVAVATRDGVTDELIGQVDWTLTGPLALQRLGRGIGYVNPHRVLSPEELAQAADVLFSSVKIAPGPREVFKLGARITPDCTTLGPPETATDTLCPSPQIAATYEFGNELAVACDVQATPGRVVIQNADLSGPPDAPCVDIAAADVTWLCAGRNITVPATTGIADSVGIRVGAPGATIDNCDLRLTGDAAVGVDVEPGSDDTRMMRLGIRYDFGNTTGVRASTSSGLEIADVRHVVDSSPPPTGLSAYELDNIAFLTIRESALEGEGQAYVFIESSGGGSGLIASVFRGGIELAGLDADNPLHLSDIIINGRAFPTERVSFADLVNMETVTVVPIDDEAVQNLAVAFGPTFRDAEISLKPGRLAAVLSSNSAAPAEFDGGLSFVTENAAGTTLGSISFQFATPTAEAGIEGSWDLLDNDSADFGPDFSLEQAVKVVFALIGTPADPAIVEAFLEGPGTDPIGDGDCAVVPKPEGEPLEIDCTWPAVIGNPLHVRVCGDGYRNAQFPGDACDPPGSGKCQAGCSLPPPPDTVYVLLDVDDATGELVLTWDDTGGGPYEIYRSTDRANVVDPANLVGSTSGTEWREPLDPDQKLYYAVVPTG